MNYFLAAFSFIPQGIFDQRMKTGNTEWRCHSFNEERQYLEFFKLFIYPYDIPKPLLFAAVMQNQYYFDDNGKQHKSIRIFHQTGVSFFS